MKPMNFPRRRQLRKEQAENRQKSYDQLSLSEKLFQAEKMGTDGSKQVAKLKKQLGSNGSTPAT